MQTLDQVEVLLGRYREACARASRPVDWVLRRYVWLGSRRELDERWLPGFVASQLAYWRVAAEGPRERELFARIDAGESISPRAVASDRFLADTGPEVRERGLPSRHPS